MDVSELLDGLNDKQREAVAAPTHNQLILAGAGSGKTRVLVHRVAWLLDVVGVSPLSILAVTFTNKAAREMRGRIETLQGKPLPNMWMGTFHGIAHRLLRRHASEAKLPDTFTILDSDDQLRLVKRAIRALNLDEKMWPAKAAMWYINSNKDEGLRPKDVDTFGDANQQTLRDIYQLYQDTCDRSGLVDFGELLLRAFELLRDNDTLLQHYQRRFSAILVDEFQDTNNIQYAWLRLLRGSENHTVIVGDDDQSIYGWRGANVDNINKFLQDYDAHTIRLEQNYRSSANILNAANAVIKHNHGRLGKDLWTDDADGEKIGLYTGFNELDEARFIVSRIKEWFEHGNPLKDCAILYRNNAQSRVLEEALLHERLAYRIYGGLRFFERQEIKDALGYMRLMSNTGDDAAFERVVNTPTRGLGDKTIAKIREYARDNQTNMWQAAEQLLQQGGLTGRASSALSTFMQSIMKMQSKTAELELADKCDTAIKSSGLMAMYQAEKGEKAESRVENLGELVTACKTFEPPMDAEDMTELDAFLAHASLEAGDNQADKDQDAVQMMTIHTAKGLEFEMVFMAGVEEGMFPSNMSNDEPGRIEEERRLCYVGMTRAMQKLFITYAESRRLYGQDKFHTASRFIREIPDEYVEEIRLRQQVAKPVYNRFSNNATHEAFEETGMHLGMRVNHGKFGDGTVLNYEGSGETARVQVNFDDFGTKWLVLAFAKLTPLS